ncbi:FHA domain-containing protein [Brevibacillus dissolubilis]|uniref:FHA domain-containing protein n=1 Tax=Brevibacillus dissolubilis TaxID=1844116 RepID=UPI001115D1EA|nr:FHA domain-containing protein [Brevibacillus dissolubilis]
MLEVRICENCNHHNDISMMDCEKCRMDISYIRPERVPAGGGGEAPAPTPNPNPGETAPFSPDAPFPLGRDNGADDRSSAAGQESGDSSAINRQSAPDQKSNAQPSTATSAASHTGGASHTVRMQQLRLVAIRGGFSIEIPLYGGVIGRDGDFAKEFFQEHLYVSNRHATIRFNGVDYTIADHSTNGTRLNHQRLERDREYPLQDGDALVIANLDFRVQL